MNLREFNEGKKYTGNALIAKTQNLPIVKKESEKIEDIGKKAESKFITSLISRIGNMNINCDYTAYIELDNFACWIMADGVDNLKGAEEASKQVVEYIIEKFVQKPKFSRKYMKSLLKDAHNYLHDIQRNRKNKLGMGTSIGIILSNYTSIIMGNVGNVRGILLRDDLVYKKTKDHSIAYMMYENNSLDYEQIRFNNQKTKLTQFIGTYGKIKPYISSTINLIEGDKLLLLSSGAWGELDEKDLEITLSQSERVGKWIGKLEKIILNSQTRKLENYSFIGIFINKVAQNKRNFKIIKSKFLLVAPFIVILGFIGYKGYFIKKERNEVYKKIYFYENEGDNFIKDEKYKQAIDSYEKSKKEYNNLYILKDSSWIQKTIFSADILNRSINQQKEALKGKIKNSNLLLQLLELENKANKNYKDNNFKEATKEYKNIELLLKEINSFETLDKDKLLKNIEEKIIASEGLEIGMTLYEDGNKFLEQKELEPAIRNFLEAKIIFLKFNKIDLLAEVTNKVEYLTVQREKKYNEAIKYEKLALKMESKDINGAIAYYEMSNSIYRQLGDLIREEEISDKISQLNELKLFLTDEKNIYLKDARVYAKEGKYQKAIDTIRKAQNNSQLLNDSQGVIDSLEKEGDIFLENNKYELAKEKYREAYNKAINTKNTLQQKELEEKQEMVEILLVGNQIENLGDTFYKNRDYKKARKKFIGAKNEYMKLNNNKFYPKISYENLIERIDKKERSAWKKSNWIPFF